MQKVGYKVGYKKPINLDCFKKNRPLFEVYSVFGIFGVLRRSFQPRFYSRFLSADSTAGKRI